jgi:NCS1 family nucleobase:cation symporter-1
VDRHGGRATYAMASNMLDQGFTWQMAIDWLVFVCYIVLVPLILMGTLAPLWCSVLVASAGVFWRERRQFTSYSAGLVACGWFSISCYFGALALHGFLNVVGMGLAGPGEVSSSAPRQLVFYALAVQFTSSGTV